MAYEHKPFAANLRAALAASDMTQEGLAREVDVTLAAVSLWCRGKSQPAGWKLVQLARVLGRDAEWFFTDHSPEEQPA